MDMNLIERRGVSDNRFECGCERGDVCTKTTMCAVQDMAEEIECLAALTEADKKEIGSYREETGLRGEIKNKDAELDAADETIESLRAANDDAYDEIGRLKEIELKQVRELHTLWKAIPIAIAHVRNHRWESALAELESLKGASDD